MRALREDSHLEQFILASVSLTDTTLGRGSYGSVLEVSSATELLKEQFSYIICPTIHSY